MPRRGSARRSRWWQWHSAAMAKAAGGGEWSMPASGGAQGGVGRVRECAASSGKRGNSRGGHRDGFYGRGDGDRGREGRNRRPVWGSSVGSWGSWRPVFASTKEGEEWGCGQRGPTDQRARAVEEVGGNGGVVGWNRRPWRLREGRLEVGDGPDMWGRRAHLSSREGEGRPGEGGAPDFEREG